MFIEGTFRDEDKSGMVRLHSADVDEIECEVAHHILVGSTTYID